MATALVTYTQLHCRASARATSLTHGNFTDAYNDFTYTFHLYGDKEQRLTFALLDRHEGTTHS